MQIEHYEIFLAILECASLSKAAAKLGVPKSTVSRKLQELENEFKMSLLHRTTRKISPTHEGQLLAHRLRPLMLELLRVRHDFENQLEVKNGVIRLTGPLEFNNVVIAKILSQYSKLYPGVQVELNLTNRVVDLIEEKYDLAIRAGVLKDSQLIARKFGSNSFGLYASAQKFKQLRAARDLKDLRSEDFILFQPNDNPRSWKLLDRNNRPSKIDFIPKIVANNLTAIREMTIQGLGFSLLPDFFVEKDVSEGVLVPILPQLKTVLNNIYLVYPKRSHTPQYLKDFIELTLSEFRASFSAFRH